MRRKKIFVRPKLNDRKGDLNRKWYVELSMRHPVTDEMIRRRYQQLDDIVINDYSTADERRTAAKRIIDLLNRKADNGWNIFDDTSEVVYEDQLQYAHASTVYKMRVNEGNCFQYWISYYLKEKMPDMKAETDATYRSRYRRFGMWLQSRNLHLADIKMVNNAVVIDFFNFLKTDRGLSGRTYRSYAGLLASFFKMLYDKGIIEKNPIYNLPTNRLVKDCGAERIHRNDLEKLMRTLDREDQQLAMACRFEYYCGLRPGYEVRLLKVGDIDFSKGNSRVRVTMENAKTSRRREVTIPDVFLEYLMELGIHLYDASYYVFSKNGMPGTIRLGKNNFRFRFNKFREELGLMEEYKLYSMKHTGAVTLAEEGEKIINIRDHLGHQSIHTTEHYLKRHGFSDSKIIRAHFPKI